MTSLPGIFAVYEVMCGERKKMRFFAGEKGNPCFMRNNEYEKVFLLALLLKREGELPNEYP